MASEELPVASRQMRTWLSVKPKERSQASRAAKPSGVLARDLVESPLTHTQYDIEFGLSNINTKSSCQHGQHSDHRRASLSSMVEYSRPEETASGLPIILGCKLTSGRRGVSDTFDLHRQPQAQGPHLQHE